MIDGPFLVIDVESVGLHGGDFAVAGGVYDRAGCKLKTLEEFCYAAPPSMARGTAEDAAWVRENVPELMYTHESPYEVRNTFWDMWEHLKRKYPGILMLGECIWPVEAKFLEQCIADLPNTRNWWGPYPLHEIASIMASAGMDPLAEYPRYESEQPKHHPLCDVRQSARLLVTALNHLDYLHRSVAEDALESA